MFASSGGFGGPRGRGAMRGTDGFYNLSDPFGMGKPAPKIDISSLTNDDGSLPIELLELPKTDLGSPQKVTDSAKAFYYLREGEPVSTNPSHLLMIGVKTSEASILKEMDLAGVPVPKFKFKEALSGEKKEDTRMLMEWIPGATFSIQTVPGSKKRFLEALSTMSKTQIQDFKETLTKLYSMKTDVFDLHFHVASDTGKIYIIDPMPPRPFRGSKGDLMGLISFCDHLLAKFITEAPTPKHTASSPGVSESKGEE